MEDRRKYKRITYYLPVDVIDDVKKISDNLGMKNSEWVKRCLESHIKKHKGEKDD